MTAIGVIGGYGSVGRATVAQLRAWGLGPVVVAGRDPARAEVAVDLGEPAAVRRFLGSVRLVVNCTAAPPESRAELARAAAAAGVPYVDPGGDEPVHDLLAGVELAAPVVLSAGMLPGLTGLLPRRLVEDPGGRLVCYAGGQDRFSLGGAADYLAVVHGSAGRTFAVWRDGSRVERAGAPALEGTVPYFSEQASGVPYLSPEMERVARHLGLAELVFYTVFPGARLRETLAAARTGAVGPADVVRASELDLFGRSRYQRLVFQLRDDPALPTLILSGRGSSELTGATAALTARAVLDGAVPPGRHFAADVLDPEWACDRLETADAVTELRTVDGRTASRVPAGPRDAVEDDAEGMEEGAL
ncbi:saccharopine dehydrogenase NADP-binding domain-containing protein [Amorphoplanes nipponensis]|uniref:Epimerase n=1 Tax=Actinoplanes nipponensis TaxID=135950 RepID=A0A919JLU5_9ACTN|nr:saccharopine dehydrogenase NADP-binding domain-containing protein [Actinoplanes nipponensis]GIE51700.1 epimerase [Actinoplanes nipponensis]